MSAGRKAEMPESAPSLDNCAIKDPSGRLDLRSIESGLKHERNVASATRSCRRRIVRPGSTAMRAVRTEKGSEIELSNEKMKALDAIEFLGLASANKKEDTCRCLTDSRMARRMARNQQLSSGGWDRTGYS